MNEFVIQTYRILRVTDWVELKDLTGPDEEAYGLIISAGIVDLQEGSLAQTKLWELFPEGTITGDAFRDINNGLIRPPDAEKEEE